MSETETEEIVPAEQPIEIEDEYQLALEADVEDEALLEQPGDIKFSITSYGADYTVDTLVKRLTLRSVLRTALSKTVRVVATPRLTLFGVAVDGSAGSRDLSLQGTSQ